MASRRAPHASSASSSSTDDTVGQSTVTAAATTAAAGGSRPRSRAATPAIEYWKGGTLALVGPSGSGKTSVLNRLLLRPPVGAFDPRHKIHTETCMKHHVTIDAPNGQEIAFELREIPGVSPKSKPGEPQFGYSIPELRMIFEDGPPVDACILCLDRSDVDSVRSTVQWAQLVRLVNADMPIFLFTTKTESANFSIDLEEWTRPRKTPVSGRGAVAQVIDAWEIECNPRDETILNRSRNSIITALRGVSNILSRERVELAPEGTLGLTEADDNPPPQKKSCC